jgi:hypothetical protein
MSIVGSHLHKFTELLSLIADGARHGSELKKRHIGPITGVISSVEDPESKGRIQVQLDYMGGTYITKEWITVIGAHGGRQPRSLVGTKVIIDAIDGSPYEYIISGIIDGHPGTSNIGPEGEYDPNFDLALDKTSYKDNLALNSPTGFMSRLPIYNTITDENYIPDCNGLNVGAQIILDDGSNTKLLTCQRVKGALTWTYSDQLKFTI